MRQFKSCITRGHGWDPEWIEQWAEHARFMWVWVRGLRSGPPCAVEDPAVLRWEAVARRLSPRRPAGLVILELRDRPYQRAVSAREHWVRYSDGLPERLRALLLELRTRLPWDIGVFAEDFAARWLGDSGVQVDRLVLDNPILSREEARTRYRRLFRCPHYVRSSGWGIDAEWHLWRMNFPRDWLLEGDPRGRHGRWSLGTLSESAMAVSVKGAAGRRRRSTPPQSG